VSFAVDLEGKRLAGQIDLLLLDRKTVRIIDFKTNRQVPQSSTDVPEGLLVQMSAYCAAAQAMFPDHQIDASILWTARPLLMPIPHEMLRIRAGFIPAS
jgi:ATP-dependent helicase/nuclease subunit A